MEEKIRKILIPSIAGIFMIGWISGYITNQYADMFAGNTVPGIFKYFIYLLFLASFRAYVYMCNTHRNR